MKQNKKRTTKQLFASLWDKGVRGIEAEWRAGGDDGSVENVSYIPNDRRCTEEDYNAISTIAWDEYENQYGGATTGEFSVDGRLEIVIGKGGVYHANSENNYSEYGESDEDTEEEGDPVNEESTSCDNCKLG